MDSHIYQYCPREELEAALGAFHAVSGVRMQLLDAEGLPLLSCGAANPYCAAAMACLPPEESCEQEHRSAIYRSEKLGEPYVFCCHTGLYHIVQPLVIRGRVLGAALAGPFLMDEADEDMIRHLSAATVCPEETRARLALAARSVPALSPKQVVHVSRVFYYLINSLISGSRELQDANRARLLHQSRVNESIQKYKTQENAARAYPLELENRLLSCVRAGRLKEAESAYHELYARLAVYERYRLEPLRLRLMELCALLSRAAVERGGSPDLLLDLNRKVMEALAAADSLHALSYILLDNLQLYTEALPFASERNSRAVRLATEYVQAHFAEPISLGGAAEQLGLSPNYLSMLFKRVTGQSFRDYLNTLRVEEAKRLLESTDYPIVDIAVACGFGDQSYFTRVFRKYTGLSPKQYR